MQRVFGDFAEQQAREIGFVQRQSKMDGSGFSRTTVFGWLGKPEASLADLTQTAAALGLEISSQGLDQRFTAEAAAFLYEVLKAIVAEVITADPVAIPLLQRFSAVVIQDSSVVILPNSLSGVWRGNGSRTGDGAAALKIQVRLDLCNGMLSGPLLENGRSQDKASAMQTAPLPEGALRIADLGYFSLDGLRELQAEGNFFLTRIQPQTVVYDESGQRLDLIEVLTKAGEAAVDRPIQLGAHHRLPVRLLAVPVAPEVAKERRRRLRRAAKVRGQNLSERTLKLADWTILVTNVEGAKLSLVEALVLMRARWQIELLFKLWKQHGQIDESRSTKDWRILCEVYAKLAAMVIQHWLILTSLWAYPDRSLVQAAQTIRRFALMLTLAMRGTLSLALTLEEIARCLACGCRMNRRKTKPNTYQLLLGVEPTLGLA